MYIRVIREIIKLYDFYVNVGQGDLREVTEYLLNLTAKEIYHLGIIFGLNYQDVLHGFTVQIDRHMYLDQVIGKWLLGSGVGNMATPNWENLVTALESERLRHKAIAQRIRNEKSIPRF